MSLRIEVGDIVQLRQLRFDQSGMIIYGSPFTDHSGKPLNLPGRADTQHDGVVWGIDRLKEALWLRVDHLTPGSMMFNVCFTIQSRRIDADLRAVATVQRSLETSPDGWLRQMLFPDFLDGQLQKTLNPGRISLGLYDKLLNYEQSRAVNTISRENYGTVPFLISGPPGTGKTKSLVELALQLLLWDRASHLLMCAPSNSAADTLVQRLSKHLNPGQLMRMTSPSRSFPEVPDSVLPFCSVADGIFSLPSFDELMRMQIVVSTCQDADILLQARVSNRDLYQLETMTYNSIHPDTERRPSTLHWTALLMDEAAQATEPEALIPLLVVAPPDGYRSLDQDLPKLVMAGDQHQLGPRTASKVSALQTSLFERLAGRPFYSEHPLARSKRKGGIIRPLTQDMLPVLRPAFTDLIRNYRSHPAILAVPSALFYNDTLEPEGSDTASLISASCWQGRRWPLLFVNHDNLDEIEQDGGGWYNVGEAHIACQLARQFLEGDLLRPEEICVMSPFRAAVRLVRTIARTPAFAMRGVNIGPLEAFQGLESRLVILCTTRTRNRFIDQDVAKGLGVIHEPKRFNVALTRAKHGLVVIGNAEVLKQDPCWTEVMGFCHRNGLWDERSQSQWQPPGDQEPKLTRLERQLLRLESETDDTTDPAHVTDRVRKLGFVEDEDTALWTSGVTAARLLEDGEDLGG